MSGDGHWEQVGRDWLSRQPDRLWREFTDRLQLSLLDRWLAAPPVRDDGRAPAALKTDLFDEVAGRGVGHRFLGQGYRTTGIDLSPTIARVAAARNPGLAALNADVRELPFANDSFDVVFSGSTLDHFALPADIARSIGEIARVLRPSGRLVLTMDNPRNPLVRLRNGPLLGALRRSGIVPYDVGATLDSDALADVVRSRGLRVLEVTSILHCPRVLAVALARIVNRRDDVAREWFLESARRFERLERYPTRFVTGSFGAVLAARPDSRARTPGPVTSATGESNSP